jgi:NAD(P)-dependent dehydrogenase (short-subunit alcohol dehydrogenase family)
MIAGGAGGMGIATALRFAADGDRVVVADLEGPRLEDAKGRCAAAGGEVLCVGFDIRSVVACREAVEATAAWGGGVDILVNAAGVWLEGPSTRVSEQDWDRVLDINLKGAFFLTTAAMPHLIASRGAVVNIASDAIWGYLRSAMSSAPCRPAFSRFRSATAPT